MDRIVKVGIIGCGGIANQKHLPSAREAKVSEIIGFCDIIKERAEKACAEYGAPGAKVYTDYKEMLKDPEIEAVHVCTPNRSHSFITIDALNAGKHVICEKPIAKTYEEACEMVETAKKVGKILTIGYQNRYRPDSQYLRKAVDAGELGEIYMAKAHAVRRRAVPTWGVFLNEYEQGGGPLIDIGTHALDLTLWYMNNYKPKMVVGSVFKKLSKQTNQGNAFGNWDPAEYDVEDSAFGYVVMEDGSAIFLESSWALNTNDAEEAMTTLFGTEGGATMKGGLQFNYIKHNTQVDEKPVLGGAGVPFFDADSVESPGCLEQKAFYSAIVNGTEVVVKPEQALVVTRILMAIYESAKTGKAVYFND